MAAPTGVPVLIREARELDWEAIWPFFAAIVEAGETYAYPADLGSPAAKRLWMERPPARCTVAVDEGGAVVGSAKMSANRPGRGAHIATASFMVSPAATGRGIGRALGEDALRWARDRGFLGMQFNAVVETNAAAVALWRSLGFEVLATVPEAFDHPRKGLVGLHLMYRRL